MGETGPNELVRKEGDGVEDDGELKNRRRALYHVISRHAPQDIFIERHH